jgi:hypothetical protein
MIIYRLYLIRTSQSYAIVSEETYTFVAISHIRFGAHYMSLEYDYRNNPVRSDELKLPLSKSKQIGESSRSVVSGSTLKGIECIDDPYEAPETVWDGLNII